MLKIFSCFAILLLATGSPNHRCCKMGYDMDILMPICAEYCSELENALIAMHPAAVVLEQSCCEFGMSQMLPYCTKYCGAAELKAMQLASELRFNLNGAGQKIALEPKDLPAGHPAASILAKDCCEVGMAGVLQYCIRTCSASELKAEAAPVLAVPEQKKVFPRDDPTPILGQKPVESVKKPDPDNDDEPPKKTAQ